MKTIKLFILFTITLLFSNYLAAQENYTLKYKFTEGETYKYKISSLSDITQEVMGQEMKINVTSDFIQRFETLKPEGKNLVLHMSLDSAVVSTKTPMNDTTMNLKDYTGKRAKLVVDEKGNEISRAQIDSISGQVEMLKQVMDGFDKLFILPASNIKIGDTWSNSEIDTISMMGGNIVKKSELTYKLVGSEVKDGINCLKIEVDSKNINEGKASAMGMDLTIEGTGKSKGLLYFSLERGIVIATEMQVDNDLTMAATGQQNMIIPITASTKATLSLIK